MRAGTVTQSHIWRFSTAWYGTVRYGTVHFWGFRDRVATTEVQNAWSSRDSRRLQIVPGSALAGNSNCKNRVTELRFLVISRQ